MDRIDSVTELANILNMTDAFISGRQMEGYHKVSRESIEEIVGKHQKKPLPSRAEQIVMLEKEIAVCNKCPLSAIRTFPVVGEGSLNPQVFIVGNTPGESEDACGRPFVGSSGEYLDKWLQAVHLDRQKDCFISNIVKCHPPKNRNPLPEEMKACSDYLFRQIKILSPKVILTLGIDAFQYLTEENLSMENSHGKVFHYNRIPLIPTYHPSEVLQNPEYRRPVWEDLKILQREVNHA